MNRSWGQSNLSKRNSMGKAQRLGLLRQWWKATGSVNVRTDMLGNEAEAD